MKKLMLTAAMVLGFAGMSLAQSSASAGVSATVLAKFQVTNLTDLVFGNVLVGDTVTVNSNTAGAASFSVTGTLDHSVTYTFTPPATLTSSGNSINFIPVLGLYNPSSNSYSSGTTAFTSTSSQSITLSSGTTEVWIYLGGTVQTASTTHPGVYNGTYTLAVSYN